jgi:hypothetical protein
MYPGPRPDRAAAQRKREAALARLARVRGVTVIGAGALTAAVAGVVSVASGRTLGTKHYVRASVTKASGSAAATHAKMPPLASAGQLGLGSPASAPQPAPSSQPNANANAQAQADAQAQAQAQAQAAAAPAPAVSGGS